MAKKDYVIVNADHSDIEQLLELYRSFYGGPAGWDSEYPNLRTIEFDLARNGLYVMKNERDEIIAAAAVDDDPDAENLDIWSPELKPSEIVSRICVRKDVQNRGLAQVIVSHIIGELGKRGKKGVHLLVREGNDIAMKSYAHLGFKTAGACDLYNAHFICMERKV